MLNLVKYFITTICEASDNVEFLVLTVNVRRASRAVRERERHKSSAGENVYCYISNVIYKFLNFKKENISY